MTIEAKTCTKCKAAKPLVEFSKAPRGKLGLKATCKACDAARHAANFVPKPRDPEALRLRYEQRRQSPQKRCSTCHTVKDRAEFHKSRDGKYGPVLKPSCKSCNSARVREWYARNTDQSNSNRRRLRLKAVYGMTIAEYDTILATQDGKCAICEQPERSVHAPRGKAFRLSIDHSHETGRIRGLLCQRCNRAIGLLGDDPGLLLRAIAYLEAHAGISR